MELVDLVVVGAGWYGLAAAKTYREVNPLRCVVVIEQASTIGGVWAHHRLSPGFHTEHRVGRHEYSDFPLDPADFGLAPGQRIPGDMIHTYLNKYVDRFHLQDNIWFESRVVTVEWRPDDSWSVTVVKPGDGTQITVTLRTRKLIIATGLMSGATVPKISGGEEFGVPLLNANNLSHYSQSIIQPSEEAVTVFGSSWVAQNIVSVCASAGRPVDWVVPESENVALAMRLSEGTGWSRILQGLLTTRFLTLFSPSIWSEAGSMRSVRHFLTQSWLGRQVLAKGFWIFVKRGVQQSMSAVQIHRPEIRQARASVDAFQAGIPDPNSNLCDLVREGVVRIHIAEIRHLSLKKVHLSTGHTLGSAGLIYANGAPSSPIRFLPTGIESKLGLPGSARTNGPQIGQEARLELLRRFPILRKTEIPLSVGQKPVVGDYRLTRLMVPPSMVQARSIVFLGAVMPTHAPLVAPIQALWAAVYLSGKLAVVPTAKCPESLRKQAVDHSKAMDFNQVECSHMEDICWEAALHSDFGQLRYAETLGAPEVERRFQYDVLPYLDLLVRDLGLQSRRKSGILAELWDAYTPRDYRGLTGEWKENNRGTDRLERLVEAAK